MRRNGGGWRIGMPIVDESERERWRWTEKTDDRMIGKRQCRSLASCSLLLESNNGSVNSESYDVVWSRYG